MVLRFSSTFLLLVSAAPAWAEGSAQVPEGSNLTLFGLGILGVVIGRRFSMRRRSDKD